MSHRTKIVCDAQWFQGVMQEGYAAGYLRHNNQWTDVTDLFKTRYQSACEFLTRHVTVQKYLCDIIYARIGSSNVDALIDPDQLREFTCYTMEKSFLSAMFDTLEDLLGGASSTQRLASMDALMAFAVMDWFIQYHRYNRSVLQVRPIPTT